MLILVLSYMERSQSSLLFNVLDPSKPVGEKGYLHDLFEKGQKVLLSYQCSSGSILM